MPAQPTVDTPDFLQHRSDFPLLINPYRIVQLIQSDPFKILWFKQKLTKINNGHLL